MARGSLQREFRSKKQNEIYRSVSAEVLADMRKDAKKEMELERYTMMKSLIEAAEKDLKAKTQRLRELVDSQLRPEFQRKFELEKRDELHKEIEAELRPILLVKIRQEEVERLKIQAKAELRPLLLAQVREEEKELLKTEVEAELRQSIEQEIRETLEAQVPSRRKARSKKGSRSSGHVTKKTVLSSEFVREDAESEVNT